MDKVIQMQDRIRARLGVDASYKGPDPACMAVGLVPSTGPDACDVETVNGLPVAIGHEFEFLGVPRDYPECSYCWVIEENDVLMWIVLPKCGDRQDNVMLAF